MKVYLCYDSTYGELIYSKSFISFSRAREYFIEYTRKYTGGNDADVSNAVAEAEQEFDYYIPRYMDAESTVMTVKVITTED